MKITLTGSLGNITKPLAQQLIKAGNQVTIISSQAVKQTEIEALGATPAIGTLTDVTFLTKTFTNAGAVYLMVPPSLQATDFRAYANGIGDSYVEAIKASGVKKIVFLSSVGAHLDSGNGPIIGSHDNEEKLSKLDAAVTFIRPGFFYTNFYGNINMIKHMGILGNNYPADTRVVFVHPADIAAAIADEIQKPLTGQSIRYVYSDEMTIGEATAILGKAIGKPELPYVELADEQLAGGLQQAGFSEDMANKFVEMGQITRSGAIWTELDQHKPQRGNISLQDFSAEFAQAFSLS